MGNRIEPKNKLFYFALIAIALVLFSVQIVFAAMTWSNPVVIDTSSWSWHHNFSHANTKTTDSSYFDVYTIASNGYVFNPGFRLVNSDGVARTNQVSLPADGYSSVGSGNTGTIGYAYYASMCPNFLEPWEYNGSAKMQFKSR